MKPRIERRILIRESALQMPHLTQTVRVGLAVGDGTVGVVVTYLAEGGRESRESQGRCQLNT